MSSKAKGNSNQNIQVFVRVRPSTSSDSKSHSVVEVKSDKEISVKDTKQNNSFKTFTFNNVFGPNTAQIEVYRSVVQPLIEEVLSGYNCTVFAYGQTGTGKTFTMEGERSTDANTTWENDPLAGIVPRTLSQLFDELRLLQVDFSVKVSLLELYNEELFDLLSPADDMAKLRIYEDSAKKGAVIVSGLEEVFVHSKTDVYNIMKKGSEKRQTASTLMNARSSRSHTVFTVTVHIRESTSDGEEVMRSGKMNLVDLAGSENIGRSGAVDKRAREAGNINQSLLTLGRVITALVDRSPHIPYRESKLTRILQESLGGCTKTSIIATVSPSACNLEETLSTLDYAHRAKNIQNKPQINQRLCKKTLLKECAEEIERLQRDLEATRLRSGVYLAQAEYEDMMSMVENLQEETANKTLEMVALQEETDKKIAICDELSRQNKALEETLKECSAVRDEQVAKLSKLKVEASQVVTDTAEKDYLMLCHVETLNSLTNQADTLLKATLESTKNAELLYDKIDRTRDASLHNENSIQEFGRKNTEISDQTKNVVHQKVQSLSSALSAVSSTILNKLNTAETHLNNANAAAEGFLYVNNDAESINHLTTNFLNHESQLQSEFEQLGSNYSTAISENLVEFCSVISTQMNDVQNTWELVDLLTDCELRVNAESENSEQLLDLWSSKTPDQFTDATMAFSGKMGHSTEMLRSSMDCNDVFLKKYFGYQKFCEDKLEAILKLVSEINTAGEECKDFVETHSISVHESLSSALTDMEDSKALVRSAVSVQKSQADLILSQLHEQLDDTTAHFTDSISKIHLNPKLMELEAVTQECENIVSTTASLKNVIEERVTKDVDDFKHLTQRCDSHAEEIKNSITTSGQSVVEHASQHNSAIELLSAEVRTGAENLSGIIQSCEQSLTEEAEDYENAVEYVQSYGAKPAPLTGNTPHRSELRFPRDLATTSPHERILSRLRSKYRAVPRPIMDFQDNTTSDVNSDSSLCENDTIANKENSMTEKHSYVPKLRKPLAQNN